MLNKVTIDVLGEKCFIEVKNNMSGCFQLITQYKGITSYTFVTISQENNEKLDSFKPIRVIYNSRSYAFNKIPRNKLKREIYSQDNETLISRLIDRSVRARAPYTKSMIEINIMPINCETDEVDIACMLSTNIALKILFREKYTINIPVKSIITNDGITTKVIYTINDKGIDMIELCSGGSIEYNSLIENIEMNFMQINSSEYNKINSNIQSIENNYINTSSTLYHQEINEEIIEQYAHYIMQIQYSCKNVSQIYHNLKNKIIEDHNTIDENCIKLFASIIANKAINQFMNITNKRLDGRNYDEIRDLKLEQTNYSQIDSSLVITRGNTQAFATLTIGSSTDKVFEDESSTPSARDVYVHYNFGNFTVDEYSKFSSIKRREIGHGYIIENSINAIVEKEQMKHNSIRIVVDVITSDGSTSMAGTMASSILCNNIGITNNTIVGIAYGGFKNKEGKIQIISDISGIEDETGLFDFKIVLNEYKNIVYIQSDCKNESISIKTIKDLIQKSLIQCDKYMEICKSHKKEKTTMHPKILKCHCINISEYQKNNHKIRGEIRKLENTLGLKIENKFKNKILVYGSSDNIKTAILEINQIIYKNVQQ